MNKVFTTLNFEVGVASQTITKTLTLASPSTCRRVGFSFMPVSTTGTGSMLWTGLQNNVYCGTDTAGTVFFYSFALGNAGNFTIRPHDGVISISKQNPATGTGSYTVVAVEEYDEVIGMGQLHTDLQTVNTTLANVVTNTATSAGIVQTLINLFKR